jgi:4-amino-4-deoxy-L-arabinose transferase-like glycosyltransferase
VSAVLSIDERGVISWGDAGPAHRPWRTQLLRLGLALLATLLTVLLRLPALDRYATIDESRWVGRAADFSAYLQGHDYDRTYLVGHPGVTTMWLGALGLGPGQARAFSYLEGGTDVTRRDGYLDALVAARRPALLANAVVLGALVWVAWGLFGAAPALLGGLLLLLDPFLGAHARLIHLDALLSSFMALAALAGLAHWRGLGWGYLVLCGLASSLALLTKAPSIYLLAWLPALALFEQVRSGRWRRPAAWVRLLAGLTVWLGLTWAGCLALWPALRLRPLAVLRQVAEFTVKNGGSERDNFFLGAQVDDPGPLFYPLALIFRATPLLLLGLGLLLWLLVRHRRRLIAFWPALLLGGYAVGFLLMMTLAQKKFDRYGLPVFPVLDLLAGLGLWLGWRSLQPSRWLGSQPTAARRRAGPLIGAAAAVALAAWPLVSVYPYYLAYYNPLLGGGAVAQRLLFVGWGEGMDQVAAYMNAKPLILRAPMVATAYHRVLQAHLRGNNAMPLERAELADYIVPYVNSIQRDLDADILTAILDGQEPELTVWINGIEYARVYRGPHLPIEKSFGLDLAGRLRLETLTFAPGAGRARPGDDLVLRLQLRPIGDIGTLVGVVRLVGADGIPVVQDRQPIARALREGDHLLIDSQLHLPNGVVPGEYRLQFLIDDPGSGRIATAVGSGTVPLQALTVLPAVAP